MSTQRTIQINSTGESTALLACDSIGLQTVYFSSDQLALQDNDTIYTTDGDASTVLVGANLYFSDGSNSFQVDNSGLVTNLTSCDITPPIITITPTGPINVEVSTSTNPATYTDTGVTASDGGVDISGDIVVGGTVDINVIGQYVLTYNVDDDAGNSAVEGTRTVNVVYTIAPVITLIGDAIVELVVGQTFTDDGVIIDSTYYGSGLTGVSTSYDPDPLDINTVGTYIIRYDYTDANGLIATQRTREVNVVAITPTATPVPDPTATAIPDPTATPVPEANSYWFHGGTADDGGLAGYPYQQNLTNPASSYYLSDFTPVADYALVFDDMIATPSKYQPVYSGTLTDGFGWNYDIHADPNFYWLVVPTSVGLPDLTLTPHLSIDGAPDDIASEKLVFTSNVDGLEYTLYKINATEDTGGRALQINNI